MTDDGRGADLRALSGCGAVGVSMMRTGTERPEAGVHQLQGAWALPEATDAVSTEPRPQCQQRDKQADP